MPILVCFGGDGMGVERDAAMRISEMAEPEEPGGSGMAAVVVWLLAIGNDRTWCVVKDKVMHIAKS